MKSGFEFFLHYIEPYILSDSSKQQSTNDILMNVALKEEVWLLDFGCGHGNSINIQKITENNPNCSITLIGLDIINAHKNRNMIHILYDGSQIPFKNSSFDIIYCNQVLEHVRNPNKVIKEISRILKNDGFFIGSVSHTEPYHACSIFNWTPYGMIEVLKSENFGRINLFPGIDSFTLLFRRISLGKWGNFFFSHESPGNIIINILGKLFGFSHKKITTIKLVFCGQFSFCAKK